MSLQTKGITKLSQLTIDSNKDWLGNLIKNLGTPVDPNDAARLVDLPSGGYTKGARVGREGGEPLAFIVRNWATYGYFNMKFNTVYFDTDVIYNGALLVPNAAGTYSQCETQFPDDGLDHYLKIDDYPDRWDDDSTYLQTTYYADYRRETAKVQIIGALTDPIEELRVHFRFGRGSVAGNAYCGPMVRLNGNEVYGTIIGPVTTTPYVDYSEALARPGGGSWEVADFSDPTFEIGTFPHAGNPGSSRITQYFATANYPTRLTCKTAGKYLIIASLNYMANATGDRQIYIILNGVKNIAEHTHVNAGASASVTLTAATVYDLEVGDYVEFMTMQTSGGDLLVRGLAEYCPVLSMQRIG